MNRICKSVWLMFICLVTVVLTLGTEAYLCWVSYVLFQHAAQMTAWTAVAIRLAGALAVGIAIVFLPTTYLVGGRVAMRLFFAEACELLGGRRRAAR